MDRPETEEICDLWLAVFGDRPPITADLSLLTSVLVSQLKLPAYSSAAPAGEPESFRPTA